MDKPLTDAELDALGKDGNWDSRYGERAIEELRELREQNARLKQLYESALIGADGLAKSKREFIEQNAAQAYNMGIAIEGMIQLEGVIKELEKQNTALVAAADKVVKDEPAYYTNGERACGHCKQQSVARWRIDHAADCPWVNLRTTLASVKEVGE